MRRTHASLALAATLLGCSGGTTPPAAPPTDVPAVATAEAVGASVAKPAGKDDKPADAAKPMAAASPPPPPAPAKASVSDAPILGNITQADILAAVNKHGDTFNRCYSIGAGSSKTYTAKITVKATVGPTGVVNTVEVVASTAKNPKVDACVVDAFKTIAFNRAPGSGATVFTFPLSFDGEQTQ
jgi:hypothetical protein